MQLRRLSCSSITMNLPINLRVLLLFGILRELFVKEFIVVEVLFLGWMIVIVEIVSHFVHWIVVNFITDSFNSSRSCTFILMNLALDLGQRTTLRLLVMCLYYFIFNIACVITYKVIYIVLDLVIEFVYYFAIVRRFAFCSRWQFVVGVLVVQSGK